MFLNKLRQNIRFVISGTHAIHITSKHSDLPKDLLDSELPDLDSVACRVDFVR